MYRGARRMSICGGSAIMRPVMMMPGHTPGFWRAAALLLPLLLVLTAAGLWALLLTPPATAQAQTPAPLGNPADLTATPGPGIGEVTLAWTPAANAALHLVAWLPRNGADYQWRLVGAGSATFSDLEAGREYWFTVIGFQPGGAWSQWSNWASATALAAPPPPPTPAGTASIAAGGKHTCYLDADGIVQCWGANGDADKGQADPPAGAFTAISAGYEHTCGIRPARSSPDNQSGGQQSGGQIECWGDNASGQSTPPAGIFTAVAAGRAHTCALSDAGTAHCWGRNEYGQTDAPPAASPPCPPPANTAAASAPMVRRNAGATTTTASQRRRRKRASTPSAPATPTPAASSRTAASPAGAPTRMGKRRRRWRASLRRLARVIGIPAR